MDSRHSVYGLLSVRYSAVSDEYILGSSITSLFEYHKAVLSLTIDKLDAIWLSVCVEQVDL